MPRVRMNQGRVTGIVTCVPTAEKCIDDELELMGGNVGQIERIKKTIGLDRRRVVTPGTTAADLCVQAAQAVLAGARVEVEQVDGLVFVTQTPDHFQPSNAAIVHGRLGLREDCAAFDVNLGCSGFVYGLWLAHMMVEAGGCEHVLLLAGDTLSYCVHPRDRTVAPLFGDAGSATLIQRGASHPAWFSLKTDGRGAGTIIVPAGAFREPASETTRAETTDKDGNTRTRGHLTMNGAEVFNFSIKVEPPAVQEICAFAGVGLNDVDYFVFHQANKYIIGNIARRLKIPAAKTPCETVGRYGNQSSASIPCTLCDALAPELTSGRRLLVLSGFGVGLSWATCCLTLETLSVCRLIEYSTPPAPSEI